MESWKKLVKRDIDEDPEIIKLAEEYTLLSLKPRDALHIACAVVAGCDFFLTTDRGILAKAAGIKNIKILDPPSFIREISG